MASLSNPRREAFCQEYLVDKNATKAAERAGYSKNSAQEQGSRLLSDAMVRARVDELLANQEKRTQITADRVLKELARVAFMDLSGAYNDAGGLLAVKDMPEDVRRAIAGVKIYDEFDGVGREREKIGETTEIKTIDKVRALELLGKHLKLFTDKLEHSGKISLEQLVAGSTEPEGE
ncbi:MAG TPA: terminase small subunit [Bdellovibrionota bacterium]|jgi:phage terminase small subunit|nr:terminase small subunit [Bdellovibrionota bacterium]